jgi:hypothetical protein
MKQTVSKLEALHYLINFEKERYLQAIKNDQKFEEVKMIYLKIKDLEHKADELMLQGISKLTDKIND